jgi:hypothetical protein
VAGDVPTTVSRVQLAAGTTASSPMLPLISAPAAVYQNTRARIRCCRDGLTYIEPA